MEGAPANPFAFLGEEDFVYEDFGDLLPCPEKADKIKGYKLLIIFYNASWCLAGCGGTRQAMKECYPVWNKFNPDSFGYDEKNV